jgi:Dihydrodipicolinate synthase/N-acetylneuraminate lyase
MKSGFYTALGTPLDKFGNLLENSFRKQVADQVEAGVAGLLVMGSMGMEPCIKQMEYAKIATTAVETVAGACPIFIGVMDNSFYRVMERIESLKGLGIDGVVATAPFYFAATDEEIMKFFEKIAAASPFPLYIYDLPTVTKTKISVRTIEKLMKINNIKGIKTGDLMTARLLLRSASERNDFSIMYSGLDLFDAAYKYGVTMNLDGMFACTLPIASKMYRHLDLGNFDEAGKCLDDILTLRNTFIEVGIFEGFTYAMNLLGYDGIFAPDFSYTYRKEGFVKVKESMQKCKLI